MRIMPALPLLAILTLAGAALLHASHSANAQTAMTMPMPGAPAAAATRAVAVLQPTKGNTLAGTIWFDVTPKGIHVHGTITGLPPNSQHGFHIHEFGDQSSDDGMAAGGHFNPENHTHGGPETPVHHAGDMGNVSADAAGKATVDITIPDVTIAGDKNPILGHGVVLHASADDLTPRANPGARLAVGVIGLAKPQ